MINKELKNFYKKNLGNCSYKNFIKWIRTKEIYITSSKKEAIILFNLFVIKNNLNEIIKLNLKLTRITK